MTRSDISMWTKRASWALYGLALALPAFRAEQYGESHARLGIEAFVMGPLGLAAGHFSWIANILLFLGWFTRSRSGINLPFLLAILAFGTAMTFLGAPPVAAGSAGEVGLRPDIGYFVWLASMALAARPTHEK